MRLTKDEVRKLTPEQQEAFGSLEAQRVRLRQEIVERARRYRGMNVLGPLLMAAANGFAIFSIAYPRVLIFAIIAATSLTGFLATGLHRRLDALLDLLEHDSKNTVRRDSNDVAGIN